MKRAQLKDLHHRKLEHLGRLLSNARLALEARGAESPVYASKLGIMLEYAHRLNRDYGVLLYELKPEAEVNFQGELHNATHHWHQSQSRVGEHQD